MLKQNAVFDSTSFKIVEFCKMCTAKLFKLISLHVNNEWIMDVTLNFLR
jgi:hypothetical protein